MADPADRSGPGVGIEVEVAVRQRLGAFDLDAAFMAPPGITVLFGPSGSGKSSVLNAVAGLSHLGQAPAHGRIKVGDTVLLDSRAGIDLPPEHRGCGMVFQDARLFPHLDVAANLRFGQIRGRHSGSSGAAAQFHEMVDLLGLRRLLHRRPATLSGGERQRVAIGRALLANPRLLLMDEPLAALDTPRRVHILPCLERLRQMGTQSILYVTHALEEVDRLADTLVVMAHGQVHAAGPVVEVMARTELADLLGGAQSGVLIEGRLGAHHPSRGLSTFDFAGGTLWLPLCDGAGGGGHDGPFRVRVRARDVALATVRPEGMSSHNILPVHLTGLLASGPHELRALLDCGGTPLQALITRDSAERLGLRPGMELWAVIKSVSLMRDGRGPNAG